MIEQLTLFNYDALDAKTRAVVQQRTTEIHALMRRTAEGIIEIGQRLIEVKDALGHGRFGQWLEFEFDWSDQTALNFMNVARRFSDIPNGLEFAPRALYLLAAPSTPDPARQEALVRAEAGERITYSTAQEIVKEHKTPTRNGDEEPSDVYTCLDCGDVFNAEVWHCPTCHHHWPMDRTECWNCQQGWRREASGSTSVDEPANEPEPPSELLPSAPSMAVHYSSETPEWYTPSHIIARVIKTLGAIDLDPCSNSHESPNVPALSYYTKEDNGLAREWRGRIYMNPPYGREIVEWVRHLVREWVAGRVTEAVALVPARTDTEWHGELRQFPRCFVRGRLKFSNHESAAPFPSMAVYLGDNLLAFVEAFGDIGDIYELVEA